jgi:hypothetical protein
VRKAIEEIDAIYEELARDIKAVPTDVPGGTGQSTEAPTDATKALRTAKKAEKEAKAQQIRDSNTKMEDAYKTMRRLYGMDDED